MAKERKALMEYPKFHTRKELEEYIEEVGFLTLFESSIEGFSVREMTDRKAWWNDPDPVHDPWEWRKEIAAEGKILYGKFLGKKSAFVSREWFPVLCNWRRNGYDFDALYDDGFASAREKKIMDLLLESGDVLPAYLIKQQASFGKDGFKGFEGVLTGLQMKCYLVNRKMEQKVSGKGEPYGWPVSFYSTPEAMLGQDFLEEAYKEDPKRSLERLVGQIIRVTGCDEKEARKFLR